MRHRVISIIREYLDARGFLDVETPMLGRSTPEGARDFLVPAALRPGSFYALPQSPQQLKQLLMVAGQDRYYQIVRCFRDEASRADRGFEFTQLDLEMSFVDEEDIFALMEPLFAQLVREVHGVDVPTPFPRMTYRGGHRSLRLGQAGPPLRDGVRRPRAGVRRNGVQRVRFGARQRAARIKGLAAPGGGQLSRKELDELVTETQGARRRGARVDRRGGGGRSLAGREAPRPRRDRGGPGGDRRGDRRPGPDRGRPARSGARCARRAPSRRMASRLALVREEEWRYLWVTEPPLFEWSDEEEQAGSSQHHPFTSPLTDDLTPETAKARALRPRPQRLRAGRRKHPDPPTRPAAPGIRGAGAHARRDRREVRPPVHRVPLRRASSRRHRDRDRPAGDGADRQGRHP